MRGLRSRRVSQRMNASRAGQALSGAVFRYGPGAATWVCPATGRWKFYVRGPGGWARNTVPSGGGSGGLAVITRHVLAGGMRRLDQGYNFVERQRRGIDDLHRIIRFGNHLRRD